MQGLTIEGFQALDLPMIQGTASRNRGERAANPSRHVSRSSDSPFVACILLHVVHGRELVSAYLQVHFPSSLPSWHSRDPLDESLEICCF